MAIFCTECGEKLEDSALFCTGCGQKVERDGGAAAPAAQPAQPIPPSEQKTVKAANPLPGAAPMSAGPPPPFRASKSSSRKLFVWLGVLVALIAVTAGLAYVAFQRFVYSGQEDIAETYAPPAETAAEGSSPAFGDDVIEEPAPLAEETTAPAVMEDESAVAAALAEPPRAPAAAPRTAPAPMPAAPRKPAPEKVVTKASPPPAPKPAAQVRPKPLAPAAEAPRPAPAPAAIPSPAPPPAPKAAAASASPASTQPPASKGSKVMLSGAEAYSPPPAPKASAPKASAAPTVRVAPASGDIFWSGTLDKNQEVTVDYAAGAGAVGGQPLPGKPVLLETFSPVVEIVELPGPENGWKRFTFKAKRNAKKSVTLNFHWSLR